MKRVIVVIGAIALFLWGLMIVDFSVTSGGMPPPPYSTGSVDGVNISPFLILFIVSAVGLAIAIMSIIYEMKMNEGM